MNRVIASVAVGAVLGFSAAMLAAPAQQTRPGIVEQPQVKIDNHGLAEAVPVSVQQFSSDLRPLPVQVAGPLEVNARPIKQVWEYTAISMEPNQELATALAGAGAAGWEAVGFATNTNRATVLFKRPKP